jgi:hypothetical protein
MSERGPAGSPQDRPPLSIPRAGLPAIGLIYLFWGSIPPLTAMTIDGVRGRPDEPLIGHFVLVVALAAVPLVAVLLGLRNGRVWALRLLKALAAIAAVLLAADALGALALCFGVAGAGREAGLDGQFLLEACVLLAIVGWFLFRTLGRVRWLHPGSAPGEWEPPPRRPAARTRR